MWVQCDHTATEQEFAASYCKIRNLQCQRSAAEMRRKRYMTRLSIRWLRVRVPSPSLMTRDDRRCNPLTSRRVVPVPGRPVALPVLAPRCHGVPLVARSVCNQCATTIYPVSPCCRQPGGFGLTGVGRQEAGQLLDGAGQVVQP